MKTNWKQITSEALSSIPIFIGVSIAFVAAFSILKLIPFVKNLNEALLFAISILTLQQGIKKIQLWKNKPVTKIGLGFTPREISGVFLGFGIVLIAICLAFGVEYALGYTTIEQFVVNGGSISGEFLKFSITAFKEELLYRGFVLQFFTTPIQVAVPMLLSSGLFAISHVITPSEFVPYLSLGILLAYAYHRTRNLWVPIGLHLGLDFIPGPIFGYVGENADSYSLISQLRTTPEKWAFFFTDSAALYIWAVIFLTVLTIELVRKINSKAK